MTNERKSFFVFVGPAMLLKVGAAGYAIGFLLNSAAAFFLDRDSLASRAIGRLGDLCVRVGVPLLFWGVVLGVPLGVLARWVRRRAGVSASSGSGLGPAQVAFLAGPSWSAFFSPLGWLLLNRQYRRLFPALIPIFNLYYGAKISLHGRAESWRSGQWIDFRQFEARQRSVRWLLPVLHAIAFVVVLALIVVCGYVSLAIATALGFSRLLETVLQMLLHLPHGI